jgi:hypothetical protein
VDLATLEAPWPVARAALLALPCNEPFFAPWPVFLTELRLLAGRSVFTGPVPALSTDATRYKPTAKGVIQPSQSLPLTKLNSARVEIKLPPNRKKSYRHRRSLSTVFFLSSRSVVVRYRQDMVPRGLNASSSEQVNRPTSPKITSDLSTGGGYPLRYHGNRSARNCVVKLRPLRRAIRKSTSWPDLSCDCRRLKSSTDATIF